MNILKKIHLLILSIAIFLGGQLFASSGEAVSAILTSPENRVEIEKVKSDLLLVLADQRLTDQSTRNVLNQAKEVLVEFLDQKQGANAGKLVPFVAWMKAQSLQKISIESSNIAPDEAQKFTIENPLAGRETYLTSIIQWILSSYLEFDGETAGASKLEPLFELYLNPPSSIERKDQIADAFALRAPLWLKTRFLQLTPEQKRLLRDDVRNARSERNLPPGPDEEAGVPLTPVQQASYDAVCQYIISNTPDQ